MDAGKQKVITKGYVKLKDALSKHAHTVDHRAAVEAKAGRRDMQQALCVYTRIKSWQLLQL